MADIRDEIICCISLEQSRISYPLGNVVLCGGQVAEARSHSEEAPSFLSFRDVINSQCLHTSPDFAKSLLKAEEFPDWLHHSKIDNLIDFELNLADLSALVILVLEGPGAFAELGSFSVLPRIASKLVVIKNQKLIPENSFISLGPIRCLEKQYPSNVLAMDWDVKYTVSAYQDSVSTVLNPSKESVIKHTALADDCIQFIDRLYNSARSAKVNFDKENTGHISLLIAELVHLFHGLKLREIGSYLSAIGVTIQENQIKERLYLLEKLEIVDRKNYLTDNFFIPGREYTDRLHFSYRKNAESALPEKNRVVLRHAVRAQYQKEDPIRFRALGL